MADVLTTCAVVIFRVKVSCVTSVDGIILWLLIWLVNYVAFRVLLEAAHLMIGKSHVFIAYLIFSLKEHHQYIPVLLHLLTLFITSISLTRSVSSIERVNSIIVPLLLLVLVVSFYWSLTLEYASQGISFLFSPDWGKYSCNAVAWCQHWFP